MTDLIDPTKQSIPPQIGVQNPHQNPISNSTNINDWQMWSMYVLNELARLNNDVDSLREKFTASRIELTKLKTWGTIMIVVATFVINYVFNKIMP